MAEPAGDALISVRGLSKRFPAAGNAVARFLRLGGSVQALTDVSFAVRSGETLGILGEAGAGKSTLARLLAGVEKPSSGTIDVQDNKRITETVTLVGQSGPTPPPPDDSLAMAAVGANPAAAPSADATQRMQLASAIARRVPVIVADEPDGSRKGMGAPSITRLVPLLKHQHDWTVVLLSPELSAVAQSDRLAVMYRSTIVEIGPTAAVIGTPAHPYTTNLLEQGPHAPKDGTLPAGCPYHPICSYVMDLCTTTMPPLEAKAPQHEVACHALVAGPNGPEFRAEAGSARKLDRLRYREVMGSE